MCKTSTECQKSVRQDKKKKKESEKKDKRKLKTVKDDNI